jgi:hypothetical protein
LLSGEDTICKADLPTLAHLLANRSRCILRRRCYSPIVQLAILLGFYNVDAFHGFAGSRLRCAACAHPERWAALPTGQDGWMKVGGVMLGLLRWLGVRINILSA